MLILKESGKVAASEKANRNQKRLKHEPSTGLLTSIKLPSEHQSLCPKMTDMDNVTVWLF